MTQVIRGLYIGSSKQATSYRWLRSHNITHILNAASELPNYFPRDFFYFRVNLNDNLREKIGEKFLQAYFFIKNAIDQGGVVLVHCHMGMSRSATIVIYFLMRYFGWCYRQAYGYLKKLHPITFPNDNYRRQLISVAPC